MLHKARHFLYKVNNSNYGRLKIAGPKVKKKDNILNFIRSLANK